MANLIIEIKTTQHKENFSIRKDKQKQENGLPVIGMSLDHIVQCEARGKWLMTRIVSFGHQAFASDEKVAEL